MRPDTSPGIDRRSFSKPRPPARLSAAGVALVSMLLPLIVTAALSPEPLRSPERSRPHSNEPPPAEPLRVAVAANFRAAADALARDFARKGGNEVTLTSASSGVLAAQIARGAPFDLLLAADRDRPERLFENGIGSETPRCYAVGALVLLGAGSLDALADVTLSLAIANPRSAPYGSAALEVLRQGGYPTPSERRVVRGANVQQALQFFEAGATDLALVARSLAPGRGVVVPRDRHEPIAQYALVTGTGKNAASALDFLEFLLGPEAQARLGDLGYRNCP